MQSLKVRGPCGSLDFQTLIVLGPLQKLLLPFIFHGSVPFLIQIHYNFFKNSKTQGSSDHHWNLTILSFLLYHGFRKDWAIAHSWCSWDFQGSAVCLQGIFHPYINNCFCYASSFYLTLFTYQNYTRVIFI